MKTRCIKFLIVLLSIFSMIPSLIMCKYTYPVQDDFHYAYHARLLLGEGCNLINMAWDRTLFYYNSFTGCYTSSFFGYLFSGIIQCEPVGIHFFCFISMVLFYISLYLLVYGITKYIFGIDDFKCTCIYCLFIFCFTGLINYAENEDYYWFITSVQYLLITTCIFIGTFFFITGLYSRKTHNILFSGIMGFLGAGGALNIAAMCFILFSFIAFWGIFALKNKVPAISVLIVVFIGCLINGLAPGNYIRYETPLTLLALIESAINSVKYTFIRINEYLNKPLFVLIILALIIGLFMWIPNDHLSVCRLPLIFTTLCIISISLVIFPVMLGYGWDCYFIICRSNFISDTVIFLCFFVILIYWRCWLYKKRSNLVIQRKHGFVGLLVLVLLSCIKLNSMPGKGTAFYTQIEDLKNGVPQNYSSFWIDVYEEIEKSNNEIAVLYRDNIPEDVTCLINPVVMIGDYDYENTPYNYSMSQFYEKKATFLYLNGEND